MVLEICTGQKSSMKINKGQLLKKKKKKKKKQSRVMVHVHCTPP